VEVSENPTRVGRGFSPQLGQRCFPYKNTVCILLSAAIPFLVHCKHSVRTVLMSVSKNSEKSANTIHPPLVFEYSQNYQVASE